MKYTIGERVTLLTPKGYSDGPGSTSWYFSAPAGSEASIINLPINDYEWIKNFGFDYQIKVGDEEQWVIASAITSPTPKENDNLSYWL